MRDEMVHELEGHEEAGVAEPNSDDQELTAEVESGVIELEHRFMISGLMTWL